MNLDSKTLLVPSIVLIIGAVIGASAGSVFADDPFKNIGDIDDDSFPVGFIDKIRLFTIPIE